MASALKQRLTDDMKAALRAGERDRLGVIRMMIAAIKQREIDERIELDDSQVLAVLEKAVKQRRDSISQFDAAARTDLADIERAELEVIAVYLPAALSDAELDAEIDAAVTASGAAGPADMGKVMAELKPRIQGRADMRAASDRVKHRLSGI